MSAGLEVVLFKTLLNICGEVRLTIGGMKKMEYLDKELLEAKRKLERQNYTTLESGIYAGEELITFKQMELFDNTIHIFVPEQFVAMPESIRRVKYPSKDAPAFIFTSLDSRVNIGFNLLPMMLKEKETELMSAQFQNGLKSVNPSIIIKNQTNRKTEQGNEMSWFEYKGFHLDGQSYNRVYLIRLAQNVLHGIFSCDVKDRDDWTEIIEKIFSSVEEEL